MRMKAKEWSGGDRPGPVGADPPGVVLRTRRPADCPVSVSGVTDRSPKVGIAVVARRRRDPTSWHGGA